jgi:catechol 2,3-dioxygenase-like lactoylglutathione lyase family enzyme
VSEDFYVNKLGMKKVGELHFSDAINYFFAMEDPSSPMLELPTTTDAQSRIEGPKEALGALANKAQVAYPGRSVCRLRPRR